jgi:orotate phosphoribosyltransferase-like protein
MKHYTDEEIEDLAFDMGESPDTVREMFELYDAGFNYMEIAENLDLDRELIQWALEAEGLDPLNYDY